MPWRFRRPSYRRQRAAAPTRRCVLRAWRGADRLQPRRPHRRACRQDDQLADTAAVRVLLAGLLQGKGRGHVLLREPGPDSAWGADCEHALQRADGHEY